MMIVQSAYQVPPATTGSLSRPNCPRCGSVLLVAEESRFNAEGRIDHDWSCDACGNAFATSILVAALAAKVM
jgi:ribosomal protein S27AE